MAFRHAAVRVTRNLCRDSRYESRARYMKAGILSLCNVAGSSGIVPLNSPSGSTLQYDTQLWDDMPLNSPKRPPYWNFNTSPQSTCHSVPSDHPRQKKMTSCRFPRRRISAILDFRGLIMGSLKSSCTTSYGSSNATIALKYLVFDKIAFFCIFMLNAVLLSVTRYWTKYLSVCLSVRLSVTFRYQMKTA